MKCMVRQTDPVGFMAVTARPAVLSFAAGAKSARPMRRKEMPHARRRPGVHRVPRVPSAALASPSSKAFFTTTMTHRGSTTWPGSALEPVFSRPTRTTFQAKASETTRR